MTRRDNRRVAPTVSIRLATAKDVDAILRNVQAGFDSYVSFAPSGWTPPRAIEMREVSARLLDDPGTWAALALVDGGAAGHCSFFAAREPAAEPQTDPLKRAVIPGLAHLWQLFVLPEWWGRGVAPALHEAAIAEMQARGYTQGRLHTPSQHLRARRFYERRGWFVVSETWNDRLELRLCDYRLDLSVL